MKTKELIRLLQEIDPEGETECCIANHDIYYLDKLPAYWDGILEILQRDPSKAPYYDICGAKYTSKGYKINIRSLSITDAIGNDTKLKIDYSELGNEDKAKAFEEADNKTRILQSDIELKCEFWLFTEWAKNTAQKISNDTEALLNKARIFFDEHLNINDPIPKDISELTTLDKNGKTRWNLSYKDKRFLQWTRQIQLSFDGYDWEFTKNDHKE